MCDKRSSFVLQIVQKVNKALKSLRHRRRKPPGHPDMSGRPRGATRTLPELRPSSSWHGPRFHCPGGPKGQPSYLRHLMVSGQTVKVSGQPGPSYIYSRINENWFGHCRPKCYAYAYVNTLWDLLIGIRIFM